MDVLVPLAGLDLDNRLEQLLIIPEKVYDIKMIRLRGKGYLGKGYLGFEPSPRNKKKRR